MLSSGFWSPVSYDYGSTGTRPPINLGLQGDLDKMAQNQKNQSALMGQQQGFQGGQNALDRALQGEAMQNQFNIAKLPVDFAREKFNQVFPFVTGAIGNANGPAGTPNPTQPELAPNSVYNPQQIQESVNAMKGANAKEVGTQQKANAANNAAGGFGGNSPLLQALNNQASLQGLAATTEGERGLRLDAATANAKQGLGAATANNSARAAFEGTANDAVRNQLNARTSLIAALAGML